METSLSLELYLGLLDDEFDKGISGFWAFEDDILGLGFKSSRVTFAGPDTRSPEFVVIRGPNWLEIGNEGITWSMGASSSGSEVTGAFVLFKGATSLRRGN
jgi:hypothetical protein